MVILMSSSNLRTCSLSSLWSFLKALTRFCGREDGLDADSTLPSHTDPQGNPPLLSQSALKTSSQRSGYDWTTTDPPLNASEHILLARSIDWASTALGPMATWPSQLRHTANLLMATPTPALVLW